MHDPHDQGRRDAASENEELRRRVGWRRDSGGGMPRIGWRMDIGGRPLRIGRSVRAAVAALALWAGAAAADRPSPLVFSASPAGDGRAAFSWRIENPSGDEFDLVVRTEGPWRGGDSATTVPFRLGPGEEAEATFELPPPPTGGRWPVPFVVEGTDLQGAVVRSWACPTFFPEPKAERPKEIVPLEAELAPAEPAEGRGPRDPASFRLTLRSRTDEPLRVRWRLLSPSGFAPAPGCPAEGELELPAGGEAEAAPAVALSTDWEVHDWLRVAVWTTVRGPDGAERSWATLRKARMDAPADPDAFRPPPERPPLGLAAVLAGLALAFAGVRLWRRRGGGPDGFRWEEPVVVLAATAWLFWILHGWLVFSDGLCLAGDLPGHHYLMDRIAETGRAVSWAPGWWGGFPMFRFYFPLPYAAMAALGGVLGHDAAFKLCSILGVLALPLSLWAAGRIARLPRPGPAALAALALPLALDNTHNMWGANAYSTLAGMIANSWSFALFAPSLALAVRDARRERVSALSAAVFAALALSHFFTSLLAGAAIGLFALALCAARRWRAVRTLALEGVWAGVLAAWWLLPLVALNGWSVDFGDQWEIHFWKQLPPMLSPVLLGAAAAAGLVSLGLRRPRREDRTEGVWLGLVVALFGLSLLLFYWGRAVAEVFVNCRLWPFVVFAMLAACATAWARLARALGEPALGALAFLALCAALAWRVGGKEENPDWSKDCHAGYWSEYNFKGVGALPQGDAFFRIAERVRGRLGAVAADMHPGNDAIGSSRSFEALPHVAPGTRIVEGGLVNSALGALAAHTVQGEVSDNPAGWPLLVKPRAFDPDSGLRHLELLGARTFIARSRDVQEALDADPGWELLGEEGTNGLWRVYGSTMEGEPLVRAWKVPLEVTSRRLTQEEIADWWACRGATEHLVAHLPGPTSTEADFGAWKNAPPPEPGWLDRVSDPVPWAEIGPKDGSIAFFCLEPDRPHVVAATWFPDWVADGAEGPYPLSSGQMVVYPKGPGFVRLRHRMLPSELVGRLLSLAGVAVFLFRAGRRRPRPEAAA